MNDTIPRECLTIKQLNNAHEMSEVPILFLFSTYVHRHITNAALKSASGERKPLNMYMYILMYRYVYGSRSNNYLER